MTSPAPSRPLLLCALIALVGCSEETLETAAPPPIRPAKIITLTDPMAELNRVFPGVVVSSDDTVLSFRVPGRLASLPVAKSVGELADAGALIASLDPTDYNNALASAEANYELARAQFKRAAQLVEQGYVSATEFDRIKARFKSRRAELNQARSNLAYTEIRAPFKGRIAQVMVKNFESVKADDPIAILEDADKVDIAIQVPTSFMAQVPEKAKAAYRGGVRNLGLFEIEFENQPGTRFPASISELETRPDPATLTYRAVLSMPSPEGVEVLAGLNAKVHLDLGRLSNLEPRMHVPVEAVFVPEDQPQEEGVAYVWLLDADTMTIALQRIRIGELTPFGVTVLEGLSAGDSIVGAGVHFLRAGVEVKPMQREEGL